MARGGYQSFFILIAMVVSNEGKGGLVSHIGPLLEDADDDEIVFVYRFVAPWPA